MTLQQIIDGALADDAAYDAASVPPGYTPEGQPDWGAYSMTGNQAPPPAREIFNPGTNGVSRINLGDLNRWLTNGFGGNNQAGLDAFLKQRFPGGLTDYKIQDGFLWAQPKNQNEASDAFVINTLGAADPQKWFIPKPDVGLLQGLLTGQAPGFGLIAGALGGAAFGGLGGAADGLSIAGDAFLPGALGADGLGAGAAATFGGATGLPTWAGGAADALGGGVGGTSLGGASLAGEGLTTAAGTGSSFATGGGALGSAGLTGAGGFLSDLPAWAGGAGGTSLGGSTSLFDQIKQLASSGNGASNAATRILSGNATAADYLQAATALGTTLAGILGSDASRSSNNAAADKMLALGAPARAEFNRTITPGFDPSSMPGYTSAIDSVMNSYLRKASTGGNPFTNPGVSMEANRYVTDSTALPALNNYRNTLVNAGNTGVSNANTPNINAANSPNQTTNAVTGGLGALAAQAPTDYSQILKQVLNLGNAVI